jgi:hypothetical protein
MMLIAATTAAGPAAKSTKMRCGPKTRTILASVALDTNMTSVTVVTDGTTVSSKAAQKPPTRRKGQSRSQRKFAGLVALQEHHDASVP